MKFRLNNEEVTFNICKSIRQSSVQSVSATSYAVEDSSELPIAERLDLEALAAVIMNIDSDEIEEYGSFVAALD